MNSLKIDGQPTSALQLVLVELRELSEDGILLLLGKAGPSVCYFHPQGAHRILLNLPEAAEATEGIRYVRGYVYKVAF